MGFDQFPIVDHSSENEDQSNIYFRLHFSEVNGFLASKPEKDKGCDFVVELIHNRMSTNWRFPVQLKSIEDPQFIEGETIISYSFDVSRLHYMLNSIPPVGLIMLYWPQKNMLYYDYAEVIYNRILEKREGNMTWKSQEKVNIHIPVSNLIDKHNLNEIHQYILGRHQNSSELSASLYPEATNAIAVNVNTVPNELDTLELLKTKGLTMYYNNEIPALSLLLDQSPLKLLRENAHLSFLAGLTFYSMGKPIDALFFLEKALNNRSITAEDQEHANWTKLFLDQYLGKISVQAYHKQLKARRDAIPATDEHLRLTYDLNIARCDIDLLGPRDMAVIFDLPNRFLSLNVRIATAKLPAEETISFYLRNANNLAVAMIKFDTFFSSMIFTNKLNGKGTDHELIGEVNSLMGALINQIQYSFASIKPLARNFAHRIKLAQCYESEVSTQLIINLNALRYPAKKYDFHSDGYKSLIKRHSTFAKEAQQIFCDHHFYSNAYNMTLMLLELNELAAYSDIKLDIDEEATYNQAEWLRQELQAPQWKLKSKSLIEAYKSYEES